MKLLNGKNFFKRQILKGLSCSMLVGSFLMFGQEASAQHIQAGPLKQTFVNPLPLPDYPLGNWTQKPTPNMDRWYKGFRQDFRELADPSVIYYEGKWIMYPSVSMAYVSEDFINWEKHTIIPEKIGDGYAPSVVEHQGKFYMIGCFAQLYVADNPLGPFKVLGDVLKPNGEPITKSIFDPMLFSDEGELYLYYHTKGMLLGTRLTKGNYTQMELEPKQLAKKRRDKIWERYGVYNEDPRRSYMEGVWMIRLGDTYYLTYTGPGTANCTYAIGTWKGDSPLGKFTYQESNPVIRKATGLVPGSGHGSIVKGPNGTLWVFTTSMVNNYFVFERRVGLFPIGIDEKGDMFGFPARDIPQHAPGVLAHPELGNETEWLPVNVRTIAQCSSFAEGRTPDYAIDDDCHTWWEPKKNDKHPSLFVDMKANYDVAGIRILWAEPTLNHEKGIYPGPIQYRVLCKLHKDDEWQVAVDCSKNDKDMLIDYRVFEPLRVRYLKLEILGAPKGVKPGVLDLTAFGKPF